MFPLTNHFLSHRLTASHISAVSLVETTPVWTSSVSGVKYSQLVRSKFICNRIKKGEDLGMMLFNINRERES
jgi:hypothetical protein